MLSKLFWFALGAGAMRYMMNRPSSGLSSGGSGVARWSGGSASAAGGSAGGRQGLRQSALSDDDTDARMSDSMLPDEGQDDALQPASTGTGVQGSSSRSGEQGAEKAYT